MSWKLFQDAAGDTSFTRVMGAVIICFNLGLLGISVIMKDGKLPNLMEASTIVSLIGAALTGKVVQRPFEKPKKKEDQNGS